MKWLNITTGKSNLFNKVQRNKKWFTYINAQNNHGTKNLHNVAARVQSERTVFNTKLVQKDPFQYEQQSGGTIFNIISGPPGPTFTQVDQI